MSYRKWWRMWTQNNSVGYGWVTWVRSSKMHLTLKSFGILFSSVPNKFWWLTLYISKSFLYTNCTKTLQKVVKTKTKLKRDPKIGTITRVSCHTGKKTPLINMCNLSWYHQLLNVIHFCQKYSILPIFRLSLEIKIPKKLGSRKSKNSKIA